MNIILANPRGFCAGVDRAIEITNKALDIFGAPIYVKHEIVHNNYVVDELKEKGVIFIEDINTVPEHSILIYSAHGVSNDVIKQSENKKLQIFNATCPLVTKVHMEVVRLSKKNINTILIGHKGHPEVEGTIGRYVSKLGSKIVLIENEKDIDNLDFNVEKEIAYVTQTTLSIDDTKNIINAIKKKFNNVIEPAKGDICYATTNRQNAVKDLTNKCDIIFVVGSTNSSNSNRLKELAERCNIESMLIDNVRDIDWHYIAKFDSIGITAGASAPESTVQDVIKSLENKFDTSSEELGVNNETIYFKLPPELR